MSQINFDATQVAPDSGMPDPVPAGWYKVLLEKSEMRPTKDGTGAYLWGQCNILEGQYTGQKLFLRINMRNANAQCVEIGRGQLSALCHAVGVLQAADSEQLHNIPFNAKVKYVPAEGQYEAKNEVTGFKNANEAVPAAAGTPQQTAIQPPPAVAQPWQQPAQQQPPVQQQQPPVQQPVENAWQPSAQAQQPWQQPAPATAAPAQQQPPQQAVQQPAAQQQPVQQPPAQQAPPPQGQQPVAEQQAPADWAAAPAANPATPPAAGSQPPQPGIAPPWVKQGE